MSLEMHFETERSTEVRDAFRGCDPANPEMHFRRVIERVSRCTRRLRGQVNSQMHLEAEI